MNSTGLKAACLGLAGLCAATCEAVDYYAYFCKYAEVIPANLLWMTQANWVGNAGTVLPIMPNDGHFVVGDSPHVSWENPGVLDGDFKAKCVMLGREQDGGRVSALRIAPKGVLSLGWTSIDDQMKESCGVMVGGCGKAVMWIDEGALIKGGGAILLGREATGCGVVTNSGTIHLNGRLIVGGAGSGEFVNYGDIAGDCLFLGNAVATGEGESHLIHKAGDMRFGNVMLLGSKRDAVFDVHSTVHVTNLACLAAGSVKGELVIHENGKVTSASWNLGGRDWDTDKVSAGTAIVTLKGGVMQTRSWLTSGQNVYIPFSPNATGIVRGWGSMADIHDDNNNNVRMRMDGFVIADGEGDESHVLDLGRVVSSTKTRANGWTGTNGWYAVNKGKLIYPRKWLGADGDWAMGESGAPSQIDQVNTLAGRITGISAGGSLVVKAALYASDRTDYPAGLPNRQKSLVGLWGIWVQNSYSVETRHNFASTSLRIRYDHTKVKPGELLWLLRYNAESKRWVPLLNGIPQPATPVLEVANQTCDAGQSMNVGWYAIVAGTKAGMAIIMQ